MTDFKQIIGRGTRVRIRGACFVAQPAPRDRMINGYLLRDVKVDFPEAGMPETTAVNHRIQAPARRIHEPPNRPSGPGIRCR
jgi:hypothetical protein